MSTIRQIEANRRNAQRSTGPTSVRGKAASSMNALKTGIHAQSLVLPDENLADLERLIEECYLHYHPADPEQRFYVDDLIRCEWTLRRLAKAETEMWLYQNERQFSEPETYPLGHSATSKAATFSKIQYRIDATRRARERARPALAALQAAIPPAPAVEPAQSALPVPSVPPAPETKSPQIGFVLPTPATPAPPLPGPGGLTEGGILIVDGVLQPAPAGGRSVVSFRGKR
jgi:hypothetical protein